MSGPINVVICDNDLVRVDDWRDRIADHLGAGAVVTALPPAAFGRAVNALNGRVRAAKATASMDDDDASVSMDDDDASVLDGADVLVLDSDLTPDPDSDAGDDPNGDVDKYLVGEVGQDVARLARAHSRVGAIVVVNQVVKRRTFDLTMTRWRTGIADAYITHDDIDNPGLWQGPGGGMFRPSMWPILARLPGAVTTFASGIGLDSTVLDALDLSGGGGGDTSLTFRQLEALAQDVEDPSAISVRDVALSPALGIGLQPKDDEVDDQLLMIGVWGVRRWLERVVLPSQSEIIDVQHLLQDRPWLAADRGDITAWNSDPRLWATEVPGLFPDAVNEPASILLGRQVWNVRSLPAESAAEHFIRPDDPVFCEDTSRFVAVADAHSFESDLDGPFSTRYVEKLGDVDYTPRHRLFQ